MEHAPQFNLVDFVAVVVITLGLIRGVIRGLSRELAELISAGAALFAGWFFYRPLGEYLGRVSRLSEAASFAAAFTVVLVGAYVLMRVLRLVLRHIMEFSFKGRIEKVGGGIAGLLRVGVVVSAVLLTLALWPNDFLHRHFARESFLGRFLLGRLGPVYEDLAERYPALKARYDEKADYEPMVDEGQGTGGGEPAVRVPPVRDVPE